MTSLLTITMNPAIDVSTRTPFVTHTRKLRCAPPHLQAGGGGINVARVALRFGMDALAVHTSGGVNGTLLNRLLDGEGLAHEPVAIAAETRESFTATDESTGQQYRFVLAGPTITPDEEAGALRAIYTPQTRPSFMALSGSFPKGLSAGFLEGVAGAARQLQAKLVVDGPGDVLASCRGAFLIKPNDVELEALLGRRLATNDDRIAAARELIANGISENVLISLGPDGALLVTPQEAVIYTTPRVDLVSAVGAGDSMVGALLAALCAGESLVEAVKQGVAAGAAALLTPGTELCHVSDVRRLMDEVTHTRLPQGAALAGERAPQ